MTASATPIDYPRYRPGWNAMMALHDAVAEGPLETSLLELVRIRASQLNGCAFCLDLHTRDARAAGEGDQRLDVLAGWQETSLYTERERAALALTEAMTLMAGHGVAEDVVEAAETHFGEDLPVLLYAIAEINAWNRLAVTARTPVPDRGA